MPSVALAGYSEATYYSESGYYGQSSYYSEASYGLTFTQPVTILGSTTVTGAVSKGGGSFVIDDPLDPLNKLLYHSFVESPDVKNLYDGTVTLDQNGEATVHLPAYFEALNKDFRYQVKPIDRAMPGLYVKSEVKNNQFTVAGGVAGGLVSWQVTGTRHDPYILANPINVEVQKGSDALVNRGEYVYPLGFDTHHYVLDAAAVLLVLALLQHFGAFTRLRRRG